VSWCCGSMSCVLCELVLWQHVLCIVWVGAVAACLVYYVSWCCGSMCCVLCELVQWQHVWCIVWVGAVAACLVYCVSRMLFRMSLAMDVRCAMYSLRHNTQDMLPQHQLTQHTTHAATAPTQHNDVNHWVFLNSNFSKEQCMPPEDDRMIETCRNVLSVLMWILDH